MSPYQYHYPRIRIRINIEHDGKRWSYSCRPCQDPHIRIRKQRLDEMAHDAGEIRTSFGKFGE